MQPLVSLEDARTYLRVDSYYDDSLIASLLASAEAMCYDVTRLSSEDWAAVISYTGLDGLTLRGDPKTHEDVVRIRDLVRVSELYALGYLYEHREEADHKPLTLTLRSILYAVREGVL